MEHYDLFVLGAGSGGVRAARVAGARDLRVAVAEERDLGGTCVNVGCVPKKLFVYASHFADDFEESRGFGWRTDGETFDWPTLLRNKDAEIARLNGIYENLLDRAGVDIIRGRAHLENDHTVAVGDERYRAETILIATGGRPNRLPIPGGELAIVSDDAFHLDALPRRAVIVGGGYIAVEFAGIFHGLGVETRLLYRGDLFLRGFDTDVRAPLAERMRERGIDVRFRTRVTSIEEAADGSRRLTLGDGEVLEADLVLAAIGRHPHTAGIGLEAAGIELAPDGSIRVDEYSRTSAPHVYAIGDVTNRVNLTPVAIAEAMAMVDTAFADKPTPMDYRNIPSAVFSQPAIGTVGLTEKQARADGHEIDIYRSSFRPLKGTLSGSPEKTTIKMIVDRKSDRVLGVHMLGPEAGEIVQGVAVAIVCGATKAQFDATVGIHPTTAEELVTLRDPVAD